MMKRVCHTRSWGGAQTLVYYAFLQRLQGPAFLPPRFVTPRDYKAGGHPYVQPMSSHMISHSLLASFPMRLKGKRDRETDLEIGGSC
jgi:hypothetical protein